MDDVTIGDDCGSDVPVQVGQDAPEGAPHLAHPVGRCAGGGEPAGGTPELVPQPDQLLVDLYWVQR
ncbi:MAG: hypothetical protein U0797_01920 [Gemmataceae bacterium]